MSSFVCVHCGAYIIDSEGGYTTGCPHFPLPETNDTSPFKHFKFPKNETNEIIVKKTIMSREKELLNNYKFLSNEEIPECCGSCLNRTKLKCSELNDEICIWAVCDFYRRKEF